MGIFVRQRPPYQEVIKKVIGAYVPQFLDEYVTVHCLVHRSSKSRLVEKFLSDFRNENLKNGESLENLLDSLAEEAKNVFNDNGLTKGSLKAYIRSMSEELEKKGLCGETISKLEASFIKKLKEA